jgi:hypothetical protein
MSYESNIQAADHLFAGEDKTLSYEVFAAGSTTVMENVSGFSLQWTMATHSNTLTKTTAAGTITITGVYDAVRAVNTQRVVVTILDTDTENFTAGRYRIALKRLDLDLEAILSHGTMDLQAAAIR